MSADEEKESENKEMTYKSNNFKFGRNPYASHDEWEAAETARIVEEQEDAPDLEWTASNGSRIQVFRDSNGFAVSIDGKMSFNNLLSDDVPVNENGIVAKLGRVGLTAERKSAIEGLRKWGRK